LFSRLDLTIDKIEAMRISKTEMFWRLIGYLEVVNVVIAVSMRHAAAIRLASHFYKSGICIFSRCANLSIKMFVNS
jgi:hypothetical protein